MSGTEDNITVKKAAKFKKKFKERKKPCSHNLYNIPNSYTHKRRVAQKVRKKQGETPRC